MRLKRVTRMIKIFLYIIFEASSAGTLYKARLPQPDLKTCLQVLKETKAAFPQKTTENELGVVITCGGGNIERYYNSTWWKDESKASN